MTTKIQNKTALRCVQNADIDLRDVFVPDSDRLPGVQSFRDTNKVWLSHQELPVQMASFLGFGRFQDYGSMAAGGYLLGYVC